MTTIVYVGDDDVICQECYTALIDDTLVATLLPVAERYHEFVGVAREQMLQLKEALERRTFTGAYLEDILDGLEYAKPDEEWATNSSHFTPDFFPALYKLIAQVQHKESYTIDYASTFEDGVVCARCGKDLT